MPPVTTDYPHKCSVWLICTKFDSWTQGNYKSRITDGDNASTLGVNAPVSSYWMLLRCHYVSLSSTIFNGDLIARQSFHKTPFVAYLLCQIHGPGTILQMFCNNEMNQFVIVKDPDVIYQTRLSFYLRQVQAFACHCLCWSVRMSVSRYLCVCVCVCQLRTCPHDNSSPNEVRTTRFGRKIQNSDKWHKTTWLRPLLCGVDGLELHYARFVHQIEYTTTRVNT